MKPVHKHIHDKNKFPFHMVYKDKRSPQNELSDHFHEWNEIIFIHSGNGNAFIDQIFYDLSEGDIIIIPTNTIHRVTPQQSNLILSTAIFFSPTFVQQAAIGDTFVYLNIFKEAKRDKNYKYVLSPRYFIELEEYIDQLKKEDHSQSDDKENAVLLWLHLILLTIQRNSQQKDTIQSKQSEYAPKWIKDSLTYINEHISADLNLQDMAMRASVSEAHFSRVFKQLVGMNISSYITIKRIHLVKERLTNSDMKISSIAEQYGFNSMPHFYRTFKKITSMTPTEFRKNII